MNIYQQLAHRNMVLRRAFSTVNSTNPRVFFDVTKNGAPLGKMTFEVRNSPLSLSLPLS